MVYHEYSEFDDVAEHFDTVGIDCFADAVNKVRATLPDESAQAIDNIAESLWLRVKATKV